MGWILLKFGLQKYLDLYPMTGTVVGLPLPHNLCQLGLSFLCVLLPWHSNCPSPLWGRALTQGTKECIDFCLELVSLPYRPVSLTSVVHKLLETLIRDHMVEFLVKHKLINTSQHGFLKATLISYVFWKKLQNG